MAGGYDLPRQISHARWVCSGIIPCGDRGQFWTNEMSEAEVAGTDVRAGVDRGVARPTQLLLATAKPTLEVERAAAGCRMGKGDAGCAAGCRPRLCNSLVLFLPTACFVALTVRYQCEQ
jgi:hypothetical protein